MKINGADYNDFPSQLPAMLKLTLSCLAQWHSLKFNALPFLISPVMFCGLLFCYVLFCYVLFFVLFCSFVVCGLSCMFRKWFVKLCPIQRVQCVTMTVSPTNAFKWDELICNHCSKKLLCKSLAMCRCGS